MDENTFSVCSAAFFSLSSSRFADFELLARGCSTIITAFSSSESFFAAVKSSSVGAHINANRNGRPVVDEVKHTGTNAAEFRRESAINNLGVLKGVLV